MARRAGVRTAPGASATGRSTRQHHPGRQPWERRAGAGVAAPGPPSNALAARSDFEAA